MTIPRDRTFDGTLAMLADPYGFIAKRCARNASDAFETRIMLRKAVCVVGEEASRMFYQRRRAAPVAASVPS